MFTPVVGKIEWIVQDLYYQSLFCGIQNHRINQTITFCSFLVLRLSLEFYCSLFYFLHSTRNDNMKLYYAIAILARLLAAFLSRSESQISYMSYLWRDLFGGKQRPKAKSQTTLKDYAIDKCLVAVLLAAASIFATIVS